MTYTLSSQQSAQWIEGNWLAGEVEEAVIEDLDRAGIHEPVAVLLDTGVVACAIAAKGVIE